MAVSRKPKSKLKETPRRKRVARAAQKMVPEKKAESISLPQTIVERTKYYSPEVSAPARQGGVYEELPATYAVDRIVLQVRDPWWVHAYWDLGGGRMAELQKELGGDLPKARRVLRVYDISNIIFNGRNAHRFFDLGINEYANSWYIDTQGPGRSWCVDLGLLLPDGRFITIVRSNTVHTPIEGPSWITDEEWMVPEDMFARLYGIGIGFGSSPVKVKKLWEARLKREITSGAVSSVSSPVRIAQKKGFWLVVNTELIVYGATQSDAQVTIQGRKINLRPDGSFSLRFALPDGKQVIPVKAVSSDKQEERAATPVVTKETR